MILRLFLLLGLVLLGGTGYFVVIQQPPTVQAVPAVAELTKLQEEGVIPKGPFGENEEVEHGIFDVPAMDEVMLKAAEEAAASMDMGGMNMGGMDMSSGSGNATMDMDMNGDGVMDMASSDMGNATMDMDMNGDGVMDMASSDMGNATMDMDMNGDGVMDMASSDMGNATMDMDMNGDGVMDMASSDMGNASGNGQMQMGVATEEMAEMDPEALEVLERQRAAGLILADDGPFDREVTISMSEWTFSDLDLEAKMGERIRFTIRNDGKVLHEFMFMSMPAMQAVNYRAKRADWSLLEHEALFEKSLLLPGEEMTLIAEVTKPGSWMFMCMLPYHMQMGMMGQLATPGMAMQM